MREIAVENFRAWFIKLNGTKIYNEKPSNVTISVEDMSIGEYIKNNIKDHYPQILVKGEYVSEYFGYEPIFLPIFQFADDENAYVEYNNSSIVNVIVDVEFEKDCMLFPYPKGLNVVIPIFYPSDKSNRDNVESTPFPSSCYKTYLMRDGSGFTKIGKSKNPNFREKTLQSQNPTIEMIAICDSDVESLLHSKFSNFRKRGEWFNLSEIQISLIIKKHNFNVINPNKIYKSN